MNKIEYRKKIITDTIKFISLFAFLIISYYGIHFFLLFNNKQYRGKIKINTWKNRLAEFNLNSQFEKKINWKEIIYDKGLTGPEITTNDWSYPWYMVKHENGFENALGEKITKNDTTKLIHNSKIYTFQNNEQIKTKQFRSLLNFSKGKLINDSLKIRIYEESASNGELLILKIYKDQFFIEYENSYVFPYENLEFDFINSELKLNSKPEYKVGQKLIGEINTKFTEQINKLDGKSGKKRLRIISGKFELEIE